jgi:hypothetical protein
MLSGRPVRTFFGLGMGVRENLEPPEAMPPRVGSVLRADCEPADALGDEFELHGQDLAMCNAGP